MSEAVVAAELFVTWLNQAHERQFRIQDVSAPTATIVEGDYRIALDIRPLVEVPADSSWLRQRQSVEQRLASELPLALAVWLPAGAGLPGDEAAISDLAEHLREASVRLGPHERSHAPLPISLFLRKTTESGGVISVTGGLNPHWARFTDRVRGTYDLDSTQLHRLPESEEHLERLIDEIVERTESMEPGRWVEIKTIDAWTIQRLSGNEGVTIVGIPPEQAEDMGLAVRRNFRRILTEAGPRLREQGASGRALLTVGYYPRVEQEGATTAMRGYDPTLYSGIEFVCLVTDGVVKPMISAPPGAPPKVR